jgi:hypothetical protein
MWSALPIGQCSPAVTMPFHSTGHTHVATIDKDSSKHFFIFLAIYSAAIMIAHTGACHLEPFAMT